MPDYRRALIPGGKYFFTLVTYQRKKIFSDPEAIQLMRNSIARVQKYHPFGLDAWCVLPDHFHAICSLPPDDTDYSSRIAQIKRYFAKLYVVAGSVAADPGSSRAKRGERLIWQRRFWEHSLRDTLDLQRHVEYIHFNPVKHGLVSSASEWPYSSFLQYVQDGLFPLDWGSQDGKFFPDRDFGE